MNAAVRWLAARQAAAGARERVVEAPADGPQLTLAGASLEAEAARLAAQEKAAQAAVDKDPAGRWSLGGGWSVVRTEVSRGP